MEALRWHGLLYEESSMETNMNNGVLKTHYDHRDYSNERTFGVVNLKVLPDEYNADLPELGFPDQNKDGLPNGCTGYTQSSLASNENGEWFDPAYTYEQTLLIANLAPGSPCNLRDSFKSTRTFGVKRKDGTRLKRGQYFSVDKVNGSYFEGARSALWLNQFQRRTLSCATPWFHEWNFPNENRVLRAPKKYEWKEGIVGHNYEITGWKQIDGAPHLILKSWQGPEVGYLYVSREIFDKVMNIWGTALYIQRNATGADIKNIKPEIDEILIDLYKRVIALLRTSGLWKQS